MPRVSRTNQWSACRSSVASIASTAVASPAVFMIHVPISSSLVRSSRIASSSSRAIASGHHAAPCASMAAMSCGCRSGGCRHRDRRVARLAIDLHVDVTVMVAGVVDGSLERGERDAARRLRPVARGSEGDGALLHLVRELLRLGEIVDQPPLLCPLRRERPRPACRRCRRGRGAHGACRSRASSRRCPAARRGAALRAG